MYNAKMRISIKKRTDGDGVWWLRDVTDWFWILSIQADSKPCLAKGYTLMNSSSTHSDDFACKKNINNNSTGYVYS